MSASPLQPLLDAAEKATPGPWHPKIIWRTLMAGYGKAFQDGDMPAAAFAHLREGAATYDAEFICAARAATSEIQRLVSLELRLREYVGELRIEQEDGSRAWQSRAAIERIANRIESLLEGKP